jgi:hypothetical protein
MSVDTSDYFLSDYFLDNSPGSAHRPHVRRARPHPESFPESRFCLSRPSCYSAQSASTPANPSRADEEIAMPTSRTMLGERLGKFGFTR